jgi:hypothetical protein
VAYSLGQMAKRLEFQDIRSGMSHNHRYSLACPNNNLKLNNNNNSPMEAMRSVGSDQRHEIRPRKERAAPLHTRLKGARVARAARKRVG